MQIKSAHPTFSEKDIEAILQDCGKVLRSGRLILGPFTEEFEQLFRAYVGTSFAIAVNSCTTALQITLQYFDIKGREVIVPTNTFLASANAVLYAGGTPVFADIEDQWLSLSPESLSRKITSRTKAVILVHIGGMISPHLDEIRHICRSKGLLLIEDASHAHGARFADKLAGNLGDAACFSFYPTKVMTTMVGGIITTHDQGLDSFARSLRHHGQTDRTLDVLTRLGNDWLLDEIRSVIGIHQVRQLEDMVARRNQLAARYRERLRDLELAHCILVPDHMRHAYYKFLFLLDKRVERDKLVYNLNERHGIEAGVLYYPPCHLQPIVKETFRTKEGDLPVAEAVLKREVCLPMHMQLTEDDVDHVIEALREELPSSLLKP